VAGEIPAVAGRHHPSICPYGLFHASDGMVQIAVGSEGLWRAFAPEFGLDRPEWSTNADRVSDCNAVIAAVDAAFATISRADLMTKLAGIGTPAGQVRSLDEVYSWEQTRSQGLLVDVEHATLGAITLPGPPLRFDSGGRDTHLPPPTLGQHNESIRAWLDDGSTR
jgi:crotonobetainyl-CoA:carnitine CoA-transferase CaiB-like acyl-CoA transferase